MGASNATRRLVSADIYTLQGAPADACSCMVAMVPWIWNFPGVSMTLPQQLGRPVESSQAVFLKSCRGPTLEVPGCSSVVQPDRAGPSPPLPTASWEPAGLCEAF